MLNKFPIFGLNLAPVPGEIVPLNIFEPRYISMLKKCTENKKDSDDFAIIQLKDGIFSDFGCTMKIVHFEKIENKELYFVLASAQTPCKFKNIQEEQPYPQGSIELLPLSYKADLKIHKKVASVILNKTKDAPIKLEELLTLNSFDYALITHLSIHEKIDLLSINSEEDRLRRILEFMAFAKLDKQSNFQLIH